MQPDFSLEAHEIHADIIFRNPAPALLYEEAIEFEKGTAMADTGALIVRSGDRTGRSPKDKRIVEHPASK
ncbi:MAG: phosphoenolpyruvate carboxykinase (ATP), partial [Spirochaetaceae bacterium]|nr:phosphoenolpyruvate carboxykinase (ATP) [Spirochaetaceae bacterium]